MGLRMGSKAKVGSILGMVALLSSLGCASIVAMQISGPVEDQSISPGMHRSEVESILGEAKRNEYPESPGSMVRFDYGNGPHQASKARILVYIAGDIFTLFLTEFVFWPIELYAKSRSKRVATGYFDPQNILRMWTIARPGGEVIVQLGEKPIAAPEVVAKNEAESPPGTSAVERTGTGFFVESGGVLTSHHVVAGAGRIDVTCHDGSAREAKITTSSESTDLALLSVDAETEYYLGLARPRTASTGQRIFTYGYPMSGLLGVEPKYTEGTISALSGVGGEHTFLQISAPVQPGNSGGPVVNEQGEVVGVVVAAAAIAPFLENTGTLPQNLNWAVKAEYASVLFEEPPRLLPTATREEAIRRVEQALCLVQAW